MKAVSGKHFCRLLEQRGWFLARINGSHHIYTKAGTVFRISVPVHGSRSLKIGLQQHIMRIAGIGDDEL